MPMKRILQASRGLDRSVVEAVLAAGHRYERRIVELVDVDDVRIEQLQARLEVGVQVRAGLGVRLGGDVEFAPAAGQRAADLLLAVGVGARGIDVADAAVDRAVEQRGGLFKRDALNRQRAKARPGDLQTGSSKDHLLHKVTLLPDGGRGSAARCAV